MKRIIITLVLVMFLAPGLFASYESALKLYQEGNYKESLKILGEELVVGDDMKPGSPNYKIRFLAAHNHWKLGNAESAGAHFNRCMQIRKDSADPYIDLALYHLEMKKYTEAVKVARDGLRIQEAAMLYYVLGAVALKQENFWGAKEYLEKANAKNPEFAPSYNSLGVALMFLKKFSDANTAFSVASALDPGSAEIMNNLGMSLEALQKNKEALAYYRQAESLNPQSQVIKTNKARLEKKAGR